MENITLYPEVNGKQGSYDNVVQAPEEYVKDENIGLPHVGLDHNPDLLDSAEEEGYLWASDPCTTTLFVDNKPRLVESPIEDIEHYATKSEHSCPLPGTASNPEKDIGDVPVTSTPSLPFSFESSEQAVLRKSHSVIGYNPVSEFRLQFAPRLIIDESIQKENNN